VRRRDFITLLGGAAAAWPLVGRAQQQTKLRRIAFLAGGSRSADALLLESFWERMNELGYVEGQNVAAEYRFADGALERLPSFAAELARINVEVIVAPGSGAVAAKRATDTVPIVVTLGDPIGMGLIASLARPGGNVTGSSAFLPELGGKQLELLKEAFPQISRVAVLWWNQSNRPDYALLLENMKAAARRLRVALQALELRDAGDFEPVLAAIKAQRASALVVLRNPLTATHRARIINFALNSRLPAIYPDREFVEAGGLMSYGVNVADLWGRAAVYVDKILKGAKPGDLPVEQPTKFELLVNLKTAREIGLTIPQSLLLRADRVIE
jgi:putative ABC transport system substrate-binding protein